MSFALTILDFRHETANGQKKGADIPRGDAGSAAGSARRQA